MLKANTKKAFISRGRVYAPLHLPPRSPMSRTQLLLITVLRTLTLRLSFVKNIWALTKLMALSHLGELPCLTGQQYHTFRQINRALMDREVEGALIDMYVVSTNKDLSSNPNLRVFKVYDYQKTYGVVLAGASMKLERCFLDFVKLNKGDIFRKVEETVQRPVVIKFMKPI